MGNNMSINKDRLFKDIESMQASFVSEKPNATAGEIDAFVEGANRMFGYFFGNFKVEKPNRLDKS